MKTLEKANDRMKWWYRQYQTSHDHELQDVYNKPSYAKERAYFRAQLRLEDDDSVKSYEPWKILGHNSSFFTCATVYTTIDGARIFRVETHANTYECLVSFK